MAASTASSDLPFPQNLEPGLPIETPLGCYKKPVDSPGAVTEDFQEYGQCRERTAIVVQLPLGKPEAATSPFRIPITGCRKISRHGRDLPSANADSRNLILDDIGLWLFFVITLPARQPGWIPASSFSFDSKPASSMRFELRQVAQRAKPELQKELFGRHIG